MELISEEEIYQRKNEFFSKIVRGSLFIYPTDTIYGIGCNAMDKKSVLKVREVKGRFENPFSVIVPSKDWIRENCVVDKKVQEWMEKLPGPYTLILKLKNKNCIAKEVNNEKDTIGVRIPNHWFSLVVREVGVPVITTSANISGQQFMTSTENLDRKIKGQVDFIIYEGEKMGKPSTLVNLAEGGKVIKR
jgi:tRNA threonylcarbamoyl adenosine modification protein (Sua5/YciO/YrdC/YwlC family)